VKWIMFAMLLILVPISATVTAADYAMIGCAWDVNAGEFGIEGQRWEDIGKKFNVGFLAKVPTAEQKTNDVASSIGMGIGYWLVENKGLRLGITGQLAGVFVPVEKYGLDDRYGAQVGGVLTYTLLPNPFAQEITLIIQRSFLPDELSQTNIMVGVSYKLE